MSAKTDTGCFHTSISLPRKLHEQMQKTKGTCWSKVAAVAFQAALDGDGLEAKVAKLEKEIDHLHSILSVIALTAEEARNKEIG